MAGRARGSLLTAVAIVAMVFGVMTVFSGGMVLFGPIEARLKGGAYVPFVVWFNFLAGFFYAVSGYFLWKMDHRGAWLALGIAASTVVVFAAFGIHVMMGGLYEKRTLIAMTFRSLLWIGIYFVALGSFKMSTPIKFK